MVGQLHDREAWTERLKSPRIVAALEAWVARKPFDLHHRGWFTDGRSSGPVARVLRASPDDTDQFVLKFFDDTNEKRAANIQQAWVNAHDDFRQHLAEVRDETIMLDNWCAVFLHVAGGNINTLQPLTELFTKPKFAECCGTVVTSVSRAWNRNRFPRETRPVAAVLREIMDRRYGEAVNWARKSGVPVTSAAGNLHREDWPAPLQNPFALATSTNDLMVRDLFVGKAHGDLSGRNILIPTKPDVDAESYVLIDCDRYSERAPRTRDPMHLLVALILDRFDRYGHEARWEIAKVVVDPHIPNLSTDLDHFRRLSTIIRAESAPEDHKGLGDLWDQQCLLSLVGVGLVHLASVFRATSC